MRPGLGLVGQAFSPANGRGQAKTPAPPRPRETFMPSMPAAWDYLILTASNAEQARAYEGQLRLRRDLGQLTRVGEALVVADPEGKRVGSGGSTLFSLAA